MYVGHLHHDSSLDEETVNCVPVGSEKNILVGITTIYNTENVEENINKTIKQIDYLLRDIDNGYIPLHLRRRPKDKWKLSLQTKIEELASHRVGKDRQAIALACYRDFIFSSNKAKQVKELVECKRQLKDLLTSVSKESFEF